MISNKKVLCIIPARSGSKGLPGKNIKKLSGKPLISYSIQQARKSKHIDRIIVSTDSKEIAFISSKAGTEIPFIRPKALATDKCGTIEVLLHCLEWLKTNQEYIPDIVLLLQATAPLRTINDIDNCIELLYKKKADSIISVCDAHKNPYFSMIEIEKNGKIKIVKKGNFLTRQSCPLVYDINGSIYVWDAKSLKKGKKSILKNTYAYIMPKERSYDIDDYLDFKIVEILLKDKKNAKKYQNNSQT